ncbi:MAG: macro domain-containing protein [Planctomycetota bacterium]|jgi:O-acetyl-ADP-ribose deacetylase (regulator of RNase III)
MEQRKIGQSVIRLVRADITEIETDAFVYDITSDLKLGSGFGGAIHMRGGGGIQQELDAIGSLDVARAVTTSAGKLKAKHIIHVNGPKFHEDDLEWKLRGATVSALRKADEIGAVTLAFPALGTGLYQVPVDLCARVMVDTVAEYLHGDTSLRDVMFVVTDTREFEPFKARLEEDRQNAAAPKQ